MANLAFEIDLADNHIIDLTGILTDKGFRIWCMNDIDEQPVYLFSSAYLDHVPEEKVYIQAQRLVRFIDGLSFLLFEDKSKVNRIRFSDIINTDTFSTVNIPRTNNIVSEIDFSSYRSGIAEEEHPFTHLLKLVATDTFIRNLLLVISQGMDSDTMQLTHGLITNFLSGKTALPIPPLNIAEDLRIQQELISDIILDTLAAHYHIYLRPHIIKDIQADWDNFYDSMYD